MVRYQNRKTGQVVDCDVERPVFGRSPSWDLLSGDTAAAGDDRPAKSAAKDEWVAYAEAHGVEDAESLTKTELVERFDD